MSVETRTILICDLCKRQLMPRLCAASVSLTRFQARFVHGWVFIRTENHGRYLDLCKSCNEANAVVTADMVAREAVRS